MLEAIAAAPAATASTAAVREEMAACEEVTAPEAIVAPVVLPLLPEELLELIAWLSGWSKCNAHFRRVEWLLQPPPHLTDLAEAGIVLVPDMAPTINQAISSAKHAHDLILVRPGTYQESVRVTRDVTLCGLGAPGATVIRSEGWEPALVLGGFTVGKASMGSSSLAAASAGGAASVHNLSLAMRNQQQSVAVYCTSGHQTVTHCDIHGTVRVSGRAANPAFLSCRIVGSRSCGLRACDHASGRVVGCELLRNRLAAIFVSSCAVTTFGYNTYEGNGVDALQRADDGDDFDDDASCLPSPGESDEAFASHEAAEWYRCAGCR